MRIKITLEVEVDDEQVSQGEFRDLIFGLADFAQENGFPCSDLSHKEPDKKRVTWNDEYDSN